MTPELLALGQQFGPIGLFIGYLIWREKKGAEKRGELEKERTAAQRERTESDKALAAALSALTVTIQHIDQRTK